MPKFQWYAVKLAIVCTAIFIIQNYVPGFTDTLLLKQDFLSRPWTLITSIFLHGSLTHLVFNMFALLLFGSIVEKIVGTKRFLIVYFVTGIVAGVGAGLLYPASLGASGAIFGIQGYLAALKPKMVIWTYGVPMPMFVAVAFWAILNFGGLFFPGDIAYAAHLGGLAAGIIIGIMWHQSEQKTRKEKAVSEREIDEWEDRYVKASKNSFQDLSQK